MSADFSREPLPRMLCIHLLFMICLFLFGRQGTPVGSFFVLCLLALAAIVLVVLFCCPADYRGSFLAVALTLTGFKIAVGVIHWLLVINPTYFTGTILIYRHPEYAYMHHVMSYLTAFWRAEGMLAGLPSGYFYLSNNPMLFAYNSLLYHSSGIYPLNYSVWNTLHSFYSAVLISHLCRHYGASSRQSKMGLVLAYLQPFSLISSVFSRDIVGQTGLVLAVYLLVKSSTWPRRILVLPVVISLAVAMRDVYGLIMLVVWVITTVNWRRASAIPLVMASISASLIVINTFQLAARVHWGYLEGVSVLSLPTLMLRAIAGPFPWTQIFTAYYWEYMPAEFLQSVLNVALWIVTIIVLTRRRNFSALWTTPTLTAIGLFVAGMTNLYVHSSYVSIGTVFLIPLACKFNRALLYSIIAAVSLVFILSNVVFIAAGWHGQGFFR